MAPAGLADRLLEDSTMDDRQFYELMSRIERIEKLVAGGKGPSGGAGADAGQRVCSQPQVPERTFAPGVSLDRQRLIRDIEKKWANGTKLRYYFFASGSFAGGNDQKDLVRKGFEVWKNVGIGITFEEINDISEAEIRIGFLQDDGAWSYVGRDVLKFPGQHERTMNFGWDLTQDPRREGVAVHEIGHTLGFPHEHQNPFAGIVWDEQAVYDHFAGPPNNWDQQTTFWNILRKLQRSEVEGSSWDPNSIMHYSFAAGLIREPAQYRNGLRPAGGLSAKDVEQVKRFYPPLDPGGGDAVLRPFRSESLSLAPGEQKNFVITPTATRQYTIQTFGQSDTVMVLFEDQNGNLKYVKGDDDSGTDRNARIDVRLYQGRRYILRIRMYLNWAGGETAVMLW